MVYFVVNKDCEGNTVCVVSVIKANGRVSHKCCECNQEYKDWKQCYEHWDENHHHTAPNNVSTNDATSAPPPLLKIVPTAVVRKDHYCDTCGHDYNSPSGLSKHKKTKKHNDILLKAKASKIRERRATICSKQNRPFDLKPNLNELNASIFTGHKASEKQQASTSNMDTANSE